MGSQMSKTDGVQLNVMGHKLDDDPAPVLYIGPTKSFVEKVVEPRISSMLETAASLKAKFTKGVRSQKTQKTIGGVRLRLAWAHSATELAGDPACIVMIDERDRMPDDIAGEGDVKELGDARHSTYPDGTTIVTSTPLTGTVESEVHPDTGIEHWLPPEDPDDVQSPTWKLFNEGTRQEWAWPCPHCKTYFVPRFKLLQWPKDSTPQQALKFAALKCPNCSELIYERDKEAMNAKGVFVGPGQKIGKRGKVTGDLIESDTATFWVSGLCSPWKSYGQRAAAFLKAVRSGSSERIQAVINTGFGELFKVSGEAPDWSEVKNMALTYKIGTTPTGVMLVTMAVDVQKDRLIYSVRGWGVNATSWLLDRGEIIGDTEQDYVWKQLEIFKSKSYRGYAVIRCFVDSGYRAPRVYKFCKVHNGWACATKGHDTQTKPVNVSTIDIKIDGKLHKNGLKLWNIDSNYFKTWVHDRIEDASSKWHLPADIDEDYCKQIVAEAKVIKPSGKVIWIRIRKANHFLDCEALNYAAGYSLQVDLLTAATDNTTNTPNTPTGKRKVRSKGVI